jgi:hypothetical protein
MSKSSTPRIVFNETKRRPMIKAHGMQNIVTEIKRIETHFDAFSTQQKNMEDHVSDLMLLCRTTQEHVAAIQDKLSQYDIEESAGEESAGEESVTAM